jgi:hypothetical protein
MIIFITVSNYRVVVVVVNDACRSRCALRFVK